MTPTLESPAPTTPTGSPSARRGPSRRGFLAGAAASATVVTLASGTQLAFATPGAPATGDVLVYAFMRGGADGLSLVPPVAYPSYYNLRMNADFNISIPQGVALSIGHPVLALHPAMQPLMQFWNAGEMAIVHAVGSPASLSSTRSHFEAEEVWERCGTQSTTFNGWVGRHLATDPQAGQVLSGVAHEQRLWSTLEGYNQALAIANIYNFDVFGFSDATAARGVLNALHTGGGLLENQGAQTLAGVNTLDSVDFSALPPRNGANYPNESFARELDQIARLIKADVGLRAVCVDIGGWDQHDDMGPPVAGERTYDRISRLALALEAFLIDMGNDMTEITVLVVSEFGRTINVNGNGGTDHGRGGAAFALGKGVNGGVYGGFPNVIEDGPEGDLEVVNDFRKIYAELLDRRLGNGANSAYVLNGWTDPGQPFGMFSPS